MFANETLFNGRDVYERGEKYLRGEGCIREGRDVYERG